MKFSCIYSAVLLGMVTAFAATAKEHVVSLTDVAATLKTVQPGDKIIVEGGTYTDVDLKWRAPGFALTIESGKDPVKVTGKSGLRFSGDSLTIKGIDFDHAVPVKGHLIEFRNGKDVATNCRLTDCVVNYCVPARRDDAYSFIVLHGNHNRVDHCSLLGKLNLGVTLLVDLNDARSLKNYHRVDHNYFGPRPVYGSNGAETMRIGVSSQAYETSGTIIEDNFFDRCNGEVEIISVKSSDNIVRNNVFYECQGVVALRHGKRNKVLENTFYGNGVRNTGGVRIVDEGHEVARNNFFDVAGGRFFSALALMNAVPNSLPNRYVRVSDCDIHENNFVRCSNIEFGCGKDAERLEAPTDIRFHNNKVYSQSSTPYKMVAEDSKIDHKGNRIQAPSKYKGIVPDYQSLQENLEAGAARSYAASKSGAADTIRLAEGVTFCSEPMVLNRPTVILGHENGSTLKWNGSKSGDYITIADGGQLEIKGVTFDFKLQQGYAVVKNGIATAKNMIEPYNLKVSDCAFINSPEGGCCGIRGGKGTFAEVMEVTNCRFSDLSGNGIHLADETDDKGRYSGDDVIIKGCTFNHMLGIPVNIYRGGSDESTAGPYVTVADCSFDDCCNRGRGSVLRLIGPQKLAIDNCVFRSSGREGASVRLDEMPWEDVAITGCAFDNSGRVISNRVVPE